LNLPTTTSGAKETFHILSDQRSSLCHSLCRRMLVLVFAKVASG
jgi:hypothetical protein